MNRLVKIVKLKRRTKIKTIFNNWMKYVNEINSKVDFGKYTDLLTYKQLCRKNVTKIILILYYQIGVGLFLKKSKTK